MLFYTEHEYKGYIIESAANESNTRGMWMGHFRVRKDGFATYGASVANLKETRDEAESNALDLARLHVDGLLAE